MDLTTGTVDQKNDRAKKMMLWFGIVSLIMTFAGWTSAYIVSRGREDWVSDLQLPSSFYISTSILLLSSLTYFMATRSVKRNAQKAASNWLVLTLVLGLAFIFLQIKGFSEMTAAGYYFTGPTSTIKTSYVFLIAAVHVVHVVVGIISLIVVLVNQVKGRYAPESHLGLTLGATFWHFLDLLWLYLFLFMLFFK